MAWVRVREKATGKISVKSEGVAKSLRDKYEIIESDVTQVDESVSEFKSEASPNVEPAAEKVADAGEVKNDTPEINDGGVELANARAEYEKLYLEKPHGRLKLETLKKLIAEKNGQA